ncbi:MAG TPA: helix-turn-helix domain-containing protein [Verrucomicrobiae bacterium]|nr:helix-turn-helix domain-containing protein [Verrucomicrobiae bacterium]
MGREPIFLRGKIRSGFGRFRRSPHLPAAHVARWRHRTPQLNGDDDWQPLSLDEVRKVHIQKVLQMCNGNRLRSAQILGIGRTSLYRYLKRDGYDTPPRLHKTGAAA